MRAPAAARASRPAVLAEAAEKVRQLKATRTARASIEAEVRARDKKRRTRHKAEKETLEQRHARERDELASKHAREQEADEETAKRQRLSAGVGP